MFDFEKIHRNQKLAYLDGLLCGVVITILVSGYVKEYRKAKAEEKLIDRLDQTNFTTQN